jgi:hypothetical protein
MRVLTERQLLEGTALGFGEEEENDHNLKGQPAGVNNQPAPLDALKAYGVHVGGEESGSTAVELEPRDTAGTIKVGEDLDEVG